jgi:hypothetical protein
MGIMIRYYLRVDPEQDLERLLKQYAEALWIEERQATIMTNSMSKAFNGGK